MWCVPRANRCRKRKPVNNWRSLHLIASVYKIERLGIAHKTSNNDGHDNGVEYDNDDKDHDTDDDDDGAQHIDRIGPFHIVCIVVDSIELSTLTFNSLFPRPLSLTQLVLRCYILCVQISLKIAWRYYYYCSSPIKNLRNCSVTNKQLLSFSLSITIIIHSHVAYVV